MRSVITTKMTERASHRKLPIVLLAQHDRPTPLWSIALLSVVSNCSSFDPKNSLKTGTSDSADRLAAVSAFPAISRRKSLNDQTVDRLDRAMFAKPNLRYRRMRQQA